VALPPQLSREPARRPARDVAEALVVDGGEVRTVEWSRAAHRGEGRATRGFTRGF
jgi:hypothetical protein